MRNPFSYKLSTTTFFKKYEYVSKVFFVWRFSAMPIVAIPQIVGSAVFGYPRHYSPWWLSHLSLVCMMWQPNTKTRNGSSALWKFASGCVRTEKDIVGEISWRHTHCGAHLGVGTGHCRKTMVPRQQADSLLACPGKRMATRCDRRKER